MPASLPSLLIAIPDGVIDLGWGHPSARLHPSAALAAAADHALRRPTLTDADTAAVAAAIPLQYGATQGYGPLLESLAAYLSTQDAYGGRRVDPATLFLTAGASQGIDLATTLLTRPGATVLVEEPTYYLIGQIFRDHGLQIATVPADADGLDTAALERMLRDDGLRPRLLYTIPAYQNPNGSVLPLARRRHLIELSRQYGFTILADEVYQLLHYGPPPPPPMAMLAMEMGIATPDNPAHDADAGGVISLGSFSKILAPGLRLGWLQSTPAIIRRFTDAGLTASGGGLNHFAATLAHTMLELGLLQENIAGLRRVYGERRDAVAAMLRAELSDRIAFTPPGGGYFFWLTLRNADLDAAALLPAAQAAGVSYRPGAAFSAAGGFPNALRIAISLYETDEIIAGLRRLSAGIDDNPALPDPATR